MRKSLTAKQYIDWEIFDSLEPIDSFYHTGLLAATMANFSMNKKPGKWFSPLDFMPKLKSFKKQSVDEMRTLLKEMATVTKKRKKK